MKLNLLILSFSIAMALHAQPSEGLVIEWDASTLQKIAAKGGYPRLKKLQDSSVIIAYENNDGSIELKRSLDDCSTWSDPVYIFSSFVYADLLGQNTLVRMSNPEIIQLKTGEILLACNYRPAQDGIAPYSIVVRKSIDNGFSWGAPKLLFSAAPYFGDGCWEPAFLQLPNGEVQVYFANESPYRTSNEQEISMLSSLDRGETWTDTPKTVSFRQGRRDGMPVPVLLGNEILVSIEDNAVNQFKPYTVRTTIENNWAAPVLEDSASREYALTQKMDDGIYMGAPYIVVLPNVQVAMSYQSNEGRKADWENSVMEVAIGDKTGRNFTHRSNPFNVSPEDSGLWNSIALLNDTTIVALTSCRLDSLHTAPWMVKGYLKTIK